MKGQFTEFGLIFLLLFQIIQFVNILLFYFNTLAINLWVFIEKNPASGDYEFNDKTYKVYESAVCEWSCPSVCLLWIVMSMNVKSLTCHVSDLSCLWLVISMNFHVYELSCLWIVMSMNCHIYKLSCIWIVMSMNCHVYKLSCLWIVMSMNCHVYELSYIWIVMSMNSHVYELSWR